jgi:hypothetical protein
LWNSTVAVKVERAEMRERNRERKRKCEIDIG